MGLFCFMKTKILHIAPDAVNTDAIEKAANILKRGGIVAFPTETVYGLGADALNTEAVQKVFDAKGRPADNPLIVHIADIRQLFDLGEKISQKAKKLAERFWPGPLTLVVRRKPFIPDIVTAGLDSVAVRMPNHPVALALIRSLGRGIVGPSANTSGSPSSTNAQHVYDDLRGKIEMILEAGPTAIGIESTVIDVTTDSPVVLRFGGLSLEAIEECIGRIQTTQSKDTLRRSPGTQHRHYSPKARVVLIEEKNANQFSRLKETHAQKNIGCIIHTDEIRANSQKLKAKSKHSITMVLNNNVEVVAQQMFDVMRMLDSQGVDVILIESVREKGIGVAVMDRLRRAAEK